MTHRRPYLLTQILGSDQYHNIFLTTHQAFDTDPESLTPFQPALPRRTAQADEIQENVIGFQYVNKNEKIRIVVIW
jgi:hypothetical protein